MMQLPHPLPSLSRSLVQSAVLPHQSTSSPPTPLIFSHKKAMSRWRRTRPRIPSCSVVVIVAEGHLGLHLTTTTILLAVICYAMLLGSLNCSLGDVELEIEGVSSHGVLVCTCHILVPFPHSSTRWWICLLLAHMFGSRSRIRAAE